MLTAASEFPVKSSLSRSRFIAEVIAWLRGNNNSSVLDDRLDNDLDSDFVRISNPSGEVLEIREIVASVDKASAIGFRHELSDRQGRKWITEGILSPLADSDRQLLRFRSQCIPNEVDAYIEVPKKPFLIKSILRASLGEIDGLLRTSDQPIYLSHENESDYDLATSICLGEASDYLPIVYVSAPLETRDALSRHDLEHLSDRLSGCAHLVVEPDSRFSLRIRESCDYANPYRGFVGIIAPRRGVVRKLFKGVVLPTNTALKDAIVAVSREVASRLPAQGLGWSDLQERALRARRNSGTAPSMETELEELYKSELADKSAQIMALNNEVHSLGEQIDGLQEAMEQLTGRDINIGRRLTASIGREVYPGEFCDRIVSALKTNFSESVGSRAAVVVGKIASAAQETSEAVALRHEITSAARGGGPESLVAVLKDHGYVLKSQDRHIVLEPLPDYDGLPSITLAKTPSEYRGAENAKAQVLRALGI